MRDKLRRFIGERALLSKGDSVIVALSGGADSVSLLHVLISLKEEYDLTVLAAHFNHGIRGAEADRDEAFVGDLCESLGVRLFVGRADVPAAARESGESEELCGRRLRYDFLSGLAREHGAKIATAHNRDDSSETVLLNITRGTGIAGLCGIPVRRGEVIRPLLCCSRAEIEEYCEQNGLGYVTDSTNLSDRYTRNRIRHQVMPVLRELNPAADENIARMSELMIQTEAYLDKISAGVLGSAKTDFGYSCEKLLAADPLILQYALKRLLELSGAPVDRSHISLVIGAMKSGGSVSLGLGLTAVCAQGTLRIADDGYEDDDGFCVPFAEFARDHCIRLTFRDGELTGMSGNTGELSEKPEKIHSLLLNDGVPCAIITSDTVIRRRRAGDTFTDARRGVTKTLKKLLNELKIPREKRGSLLVVANGSTVLWLQGTGVSAHAKADAAPNGDYILIPGDLSKRPQKMGDRNA